LSTKVPYIDLAKRLTYERDERRFTADLDGAVRKMAVQNLLRRGGLAMAGKTDQKPRRFFSTAPSRTSPKVVIVWGVSSNRN
jgi:hypothetical protein